MKRKEDKFPINNDYLSDGDEDFDEMDFDGEPCEVFHAAMALAGMPKPFGLLWKDSSMEKLLLARGYKILDRKSDEFDEYRVAVHPQDHPVIPDYPNIKEAFEDEVEEIILGWLLKNSK